MKKFGKIIIVMTVALAFAFNACYAIELNLTDSLDTTSTDTNSTADENTSTDMNTTEDDNTSVDNDDNTVYSGESNSYDENTTEDDETTDDYSTSTNNPTSTTVSQVSSSSAGLSVSDIINIFVIVVGIVLIFLGIAILIKTKNQ